MAEELMQEELLEEVESQENKQDEKDLTDAERCLTFESGGLVMYMSTSYVIEIINDHSITALPMVPHYVKGIINLRGSILPVVDIRLLMDREAEEYTSKTCIIVLNIDSVPIGIIVDKVRQVIDIDTSETICSLYPSKTSSNNNNTMTSCRLYHEFISLFPST